jgi:hypothetical protein
LFYQETILFGDCAIYVKEGSGNGSSLQLVPGGKPGGDLVPGNLRDRSRWAVETEIFPLWELGGEPGRKASLLRTLKDI